MIFIIFLTEHHMQYSAISHMIYELNIVEDFITMYIQRFIIFQYVEFSFDSVFQCTGCPSKKKKIKKIQISEVQMIQVVDMNYCR